MYKFIDGKETSASDFLNRPSVDIFEKAREFEFFLRDVRSRDFEKYLMPVVRYKGSHAEVFDKNSQETREVCVFGSADYLGLAHDAEVKSASVKALRNFGCSVSSVPVIAGSTSLHGELREKLTEFYQSQSSVLFSTGQSANTGAISALCSAQDTVVIDKQVHWSVIEGVKLSGARWKSFQHSNAAHLQNVLERMRKTNSLGGILVIFEGVYGVDGDVAPLPELLAIAKKYDARVLLDDAHATGVLGAKGRGSAEHFNLIENPDMIMGSFSKALGSFGGYVVTNPHVADYLQYFAKSIVFSVGLPAANIGASLASLNRIDQDPELVRQLQDNSDYFRRALLDIGVDNARSSNSSIMSAIIGSEPTLREVYRDLFNAGIWAEGLIFPAVPRGGERLRFRVRAVHSKPDLDNAAQTLASILNKHGITGKSFNLDIDKQGHTTSAKQVAELAIRDAKRRQVPLPWFSASWLVDILQSSGQWEQLPSTRRDFSITTKARLVACCRAYVGELWHHEKLQPFGIISHVYFDGDDTDNIEQVITDAIAWLKQYNITGIVGPLNYPLQLLGGGIAQPRRPGRIMAPFLEPRYAWDLMPVLENQGMKAIHHNRYRLFDIGTLQQNIPDISNNKLTIRSLDKTNLAREIQLIWPLFDTTISRLPFCSPVSASLLSHIASSLRDIMLSDYWLIAIDKNERVSGFVGAFPNLGKSFFDAVGSGDIADIEAVQDEINGCQTGFVAWLGADDPTKDLQTGYCLIAKLLENMKRRGLKNTWLSWECPQNLVENLTAGVSALDTYDPRLAVLERAGT